MSDSSCSECDLDCVFRDYSYDCYVFECKSLQNKVSGDEHARLNEIAVFCEAMKEKTRAEEFDMIRQPVMYLIGMLEDDVSDMLILLENT